MRHMPGIKENFQTRQELEEEMGKCLDEARLQLATASPQDQPEARAHFEKVLKQFNNLVLEKEIPPETPCLDHCRD